MDNFWERTLVDWVNCLKLQKPIVKLDELRDGIFFANLQKVIKSSEGINTDILTCIFHIFKKHYPKLTIYEKMNVHLTDLKSEELKILTSMLMHYTCIYDRQDVLTSPLCHSLKPQTQTSIKLFLEKVQECPSLTNDDLIKIIHQCAEKIHELPDCPKFIANSAEYSKDSPLYDIFKTPMSKRIKIFEKDKEISHLKASLEVAQEEKDDLEADLRRHIERNKKLEKQLDQKNAELARLKSEIVALENRTPPHFRDIDTVETERILKTQIDSLEKIIERCDIENQELQDERDAERARAKLFEAQCKTWMEKFVDTEKKLQAITEHSDEQETKLDNLKKHCEELEALLQEYKPKNSEEESFIEESFQLAPAPKRRSETYCTSYEDLAHSVVDLQLKEKEKENESLAIINENLNDQVEQLMAKCAELTNEKQTIQRKLEEFIQICNDTNKKLEEATNQNGECRSEIETLTIKSENLKDQVEQLLSENTDMNNRNETMERELEAYVQTCGILEGNLENLKTEKEQLSEEKFQILQDLVDSVTQLKLIKIELESVTEKKELVDVELQNSVSKCGDLERNIQKLTEDKENVQNTNSQLQAKIVSLESEIVQIEQHKDALELKIEETEAVLLKNDESIEKMKREINSLEEHNRALMFENVELKTCKNRFNDTLKHFCESYRQELSFLKEEKSDLRRETKSALESISHLLQTLHKEAGQLLVDKNEIHLKLMVEVADKTEALSNLEKLMNYNNDLRNQLDVTTQANSEFNQQIQQLTCKIEELVVELEQTRSEMNEKIRDYEKKDAQKSEQIASLVDEKEHAEGESSRLLTELGTVQTELKHVSEDCVNLAKEKLSLEHNVIELKLKVDKQSTVNEEHLQKVKNLTAELAAMAENYQMIIKEKDSLQNTISQHIEATSKLEQALVELKYKLEDVVNEKANLSNELDVLRKEFKEATEKSHETCKSLEDSINQLKEEKKKNITENEHLSKVLQEKQHDLECLNAKHDESSEKCRQLLAEKELLVQDLSEMTAVKEGMEIQLSFLKQDLVKFEQKTIELTNSLDIKIDEYRRCADERDVLKTEVTTLQLNLQQVLSEQEELTVELKDEIVKLNAKLDAKIEECQACYRNNEELSKHLIDISTQKDEFEFALSTLKEEMQTVVNKNAEIMDKFKNEISELNEKLDAKNEEYQTCSNEKQQLSEKLVQLFSEKDQLEAQTRELKLDLENLVSEKQDLKNKLHTRADEYQHIVKEKDRLADRISVIFSEKIFLESELSSLKVDLQNLLAESKENTKKFEILQRKLKDELENLNVEKCALSEELQTQKNTFYSKLQKSFAEKQVINKELNILRHLHLKLADEVRQFIEETGKIDVMKTFIHDILQKHTETCNTFHESIMNLQRENEQLSEENKKLSGELESAKIQLDDINQEKDGLKKNLELLKLENTELKDNKDTVTDELKNHINLCKRFKQDITDLKIQNSQAVHQLNVALNEMTEVLRKLFSVSNNLAGDKKELTNELNKVTQEKRKLEIVLEEINCEHAALIRELESVVSDKNAKLKKYEKILEQTSNELKAASFEKQEAELKNVELNNKLQKAEEKITILEDDLERVKLEASECKKIQDQLQRENADIMEETSIQKSRLNQELQEAKKDLETVIEHKDKEFAVLSEQLEGSVKLCSELQGQKEVLEKELQVYIDSCNNLVKQVEGLKEDKQHLLKENEFHLKEIQNLANVAQLNKQQIENITREKNELGEKLKTIESEKYDLLTSYEAVIAEKEVITSKLMYVSNKIREISDKLELTSNARTDAQNVGELHCQNIFENLEAISNKLDVMLKERDVFDIVDKLSEEKADLIQTLELTMSDLRKTLFEKTNLAESLDKVTKELEKLSVDKHNLCEELEMQRRELAKVKKERSEILASQTTVLKETESSIRLAHENAVDIKNDLSRRIEQLEKEKQNVKKHLEADLQKIRDAYSKVVSINSKLELETVNLRRKIEEKNELLTNYTQVKEAYEKLLEENNKFMTEVDTLKYKRSRDREEFVNIVKKERTVAVEQENRKIREIKNEYEKKLQKMKERMLNLYKEEVNKEMQKVKDGHDESTFLQRTIEDLRQSLAEAEEKVQLLETELEMFKIKEAQMQKVTFASRDSIRSAKDLQLDCIRLSGSLQSLGREDKIMPAPNSTQMSRKVKSVSTMQSVSDRVTKNIQDRKIATLPRSRVDIEETVTVSRRTSIGVERVGHNLEMEDEEDDFNNKYLADMKAGRCAVTHGSGSNANRLSELVWRNSLVPPHLKSSYPAETQFISPGQFKEDDIKTGNVELDDSLCKLLPGEKPRQKKDFGTTSYKKPGPPTPSKNGGRLSLQGNEVQPLRDYNERTPKKVTTPSRIKALFMGKTSSKENSETQNVTPGTSRRLSIFRKQKQ